MKMMKKISIIFLSVLFVLLISCKEPNKKVDIKRLTQDAIHGDVEAQFTLAFYYEKGQHVEKNYDEAFKWYKKAAESGGAVTALLLAHCYEDGIGTEKDDKKVYELTMYAAEKNYSLAQYRVGAYLFLDLGLKRMN